MTLGKMVDNELLDRIYEAALVPETWPDVLARVASGGGHFGGVLYAVTPGRTKTGTVALSAEPRWVACEKVAPYVDRFVHDGWLSRNLRAERAVASKHLGFVTDHDLCTPQEIAEEPIYKYLQALGMGWHCGMTVQVPTGDILIFNFERRASDGPADLRDIERLDAIKGHLARSALFASRLGLERARAGVEALEIVGLPAALLSKQGLCIATNALFSALHDRVFAKDNGGRLKFKNTRLDHIFQASLNAIQSDELGKASQLLSLPIPAMGDCAPMIVHLFPTRRAARDVFTGAACALLVTKLQNGHAPSSRILRGLFDLTTAEADIASAIAGGRSVQDIALSSGRAEGTIRQQLKAVFHKTGVRRQAELVSLLASVGGREHG